MQPDHVDVLIVGAGLSGIGAACHLEMSRPGKSYAVLEMREGIGGTWDLFRYPGVRSDSDMFTFGYSFKPWLGNVVLAPGDSIRDYVTETAREHGVTEKIRFGHRVRAASWSSDEQRWTVRAEHAGEEVVLTSSFICMASGYYDYDNPHDPEFAGIERFGGEVVHPQFWPEELDHTGKKVVVIGSGATAVTVVPAMAERAEHVTMLQRSPSYILSTPAVDRMATRLARFLPDIAVLRLMRAKHLTSFLGFFKLSRARPRLVRALVRSQAKRRLPEGYDIDTHFNPSYEPWVQRMCFVPDGDLFRAIGEGRASVVTDRIETFTEDGIRLESGEQLEADVVVTATGLKLLLFGGIELTVDGAAVDPGDRHTYRAMMIEGVPNLIWVVGYTNAAWTLRCNLTCAYMCRLLDHMDAKGYRSVVPRLDDPATPKGPFIDFESGYVQRSIHTFPKQGPAPPWRGYMSYPRDLWFIGRAELEDGVLEFGGPSGAPGDDDGGAVLRREGDVAPGDSLGARAGAA